ncbi:putative transcription factor C2H2 family [Helianthus annuus]|nr:putative transcription factor C2H2 family [Helianthus annuus]
MIMILYQLCPLALQNRDNSTSPLLCTFTTTPPCNSANLALLNLPSPSQLSQTLFIPTSLIPTSPLSLSLSSLSLLSLSLSSNPCRSMTSQDTFHWRYDELDDKNFQIRGRTLFFIIVLFSVVISITLIFLYIRWICRFSSSSSTSSATVTNTTPFSRTQGLDSAVIDGLPIVLHHRNSTTSLGVDECCICLGVFEEGEKVKVWPKCFHEYHCECVDKWLTTHSSCPICRAPVLVDSPV